jgi:urea transport system substrate-binding protein
MIISRRDLLTTFAKIFVGAATCCLPDAIIHRSHGAQGNPWIHKGGILKIGFLWSLTGNLSVIEAESAKVGLFWADRVNRDGGVAGMKLVPVVVDAKSNMKTYLQGVLHLMDDERVVAVFGGYTSASRRAIMPKITLRDHLLYYPTCYAGRECWQNIVCTGPIANQHSFDLMQYMKKHHGPRAFFLGSNYIWPRISNLHARKWLEDAGGEVAGTASVPLGKGREGEFVPIFKRIKKLRPDWIFSTLVADSDLYFRQEYSKADLRPDTLPTASLTTSEMEVSAMGCEYGEGHILSAPYFQSLDNPTNQRFVHAFLGSEYGDSGVTHYNMEETYLSFLFFQKAVEKVVVDEGIQSVTPRAIRDHSGGLKLIDAESPEGEVKIDPENFNIWLRPKIGCFNSRGQIDLLFERKELVRPDPYILYPHRGKCMPDGLHSPNGKVIKAAL